MRGPSRQTGCASCATLGSLPESRGDKSCPRVEQSWERLGGAFEVKRPPPAWPRPTINRSLEHCSSFRFNGTKMPFREQASGLDEAIARFRSRVMVSEKYMFRRLTVLGASQFRTCRVLEGRWANVGRSCHACAMISPLCARRQCA